MLQKHSVDTYLHVRLLLAVVGALIVHGRAILLRHALPLLLGVLGLCGVHHGSLVLRGLRILGLLLGSLHHLLLHVRLVSVLAILTTGHLRLLLQILGGLTALYPRLLLEHHLLLVRHIVHSGLRGGLVRVRGRLGSDCVQFLAVKAARKELLTVVVCIVT